MLPPIPLCNLGQRESKLPIDLVFQEMEFGKEVQRQTHAQFAEDWKQSMMKVFEVAQKNIGKSAEYNKRYYDRKAKAVEIVAGDMVLVRNKRAKGGTGKLRSHWEEAIFKVVEKKENIPVYKIKNIKKSKDVRVVHRNMLMKCDELPLDSFEVKEKKLKTQIGEVMPENSKLRKTETMEREAEEEESDDVAVMVYQDCGSSSDRGRDVIDTNQDVFEEARHCSEQAEFEIESPHNISDADDESSEASTFLGFEESSQDLAFLGEDEAQEDVGSSENGNSGVDENSDSEEEAAPTIRKSSRSGKKRRIYTYNTLGGTPVLEMN